MNKTIIILFLSFFIFSCKNENKTLITKNSGNLEIVEQSQSKILNENCVVFISPSSSKINLLKKKLGNDFYTIADDINFYSANASEFLDSLKVKHIEAEETTLLSFNDKSGKLTKIEAVKNNNDWYAVLYNDNDKKFEITNLVDFNTNYKFFFKIQINNIISFKSINEIESQMNEKYSKIKDVKCDLNKDNLQDVILVFEPKNKTSNNDSSILIDSPILVLINQGNNKFSLSKNVNIIQTANSNCPSDGFGNIVVKDNYFTVEQNSCGGWYFADEYITFKYIMETKQIVLQKFSQVFTDRKDPNREIPDLIANSKNFGTLEFDNFNREMIIEKLKK